MSAVYDSSKHAVYVSAYDLCAYVLRGGDINSRDYRRGNKYGGAIVSHVMKTTKPNIADALCFTEMYDGITLVVYTYPEGILQDENGVYAIEKIHTVPYELDFIQNGELEISIESTVATAYIAMRSLGGSQMDARLTFIEEGGEESRTFAQTLSFKEAEMRFKSIVEMFVPIMNILYSRSGKCVKQLADLKFPDSEMMKTYTRGTLDFTLECLDYIKDTKKDLIIRTVVVPHINDREEILEKYISLVEKYSPKYWELLPFHTMGFFKYEENGIENPLKGTPALEASRLKELKDFLRGKTNIIIK